MKKIVRIFEEQMKFAPFLAEPGRMTTLRQLACMRVCIYIIKGVKCKIFRTLNHS